MDVLEYWQLRRHPFENLPDPYFFYFSHTHREALLRLVYGVAKKKGIMLVTGNIGAGKTLISYVLVKKLPHDLINIGMVINPDLAPFPFLKEVAYQLGVDSEKCKDKREVVGILNEMLFKTAREGRHTFLIIDEAQTIKDQNVFEELRLLSNFQSDTQFLLTILLLGQPELREMIKGFPQLEQRVSIKYHLGSLDLLETQEYISFRLKKAGGDNPFTKNGMEIIHWHSEGIPRRINDICDLALFLGCKYEKRVINKNILSEVIKEYKI